LSLDSFDKKSERIGKSKSRVIEEIESWQPFANALRADYKEQYERMVDRCLEYLPSMEVSAEPFPSEALFMGLLFLQHRMIEQLSAKVEALQLEREEQNANTETK
jgi:hypothetical protein